MGFSCTSFVQSVEDFRCVGLWGQVLVAADLRCAHTLCGLILRVRMVKSGMGTLHQVRKQEYHFIIMSYSTSLCQGVQQIQEVLSFPWKRALVARQCLSFEERGFIWLWWNFLFNSQMKNIRVNKKKQEVDERDVQLHYKKARLLPEEILVLEGRELMCMDVSQAMIFGWHVLFSSIAIAWGHQTHISHFLNIQSAG